MLAWLLWQLERIQRIHAVAGMLISEFGVEAEAEARRREREANSAGTAREWGRVVSVVARRTPKRAALEAATDQTLLEFGSVAEPTWIAPDRPRAGETSRRQSWIQVPSKRQSSVSSSADH